MSSYIIGIDAANPEHWDLALHHGFWDMTRRRDFREGDILCFWQAQGSLLGMVRVVGEVMEIAPSTSKPWNLTDEKLDDYQYRVHFDTITDVAATQPTWSELKAHTGVRGATNFGPRPVPTSGEAWLLEQFDHYAIPSDRVSDLIADLVQGPQPGLDVADLEDDQRRRTEAAIVVRRGRRRFRNRLLKAYRATCAVTGSTTSQVLEAAHISPYRGDHTDSVQNGLLLRADVHTLFDLYLLSVDAATLKIRTAPGLGAPYHQLEAGLLALPQQRSEHPNRHALRQHNDRCDWW